MKRVLVLGSNGFLGGHVVRELRSRGDAVRVFERRPPALMDPEIDFRLGLLEDTAALAGAMADVDAVVYLSWTGYPATIQDDFALDVQANLGTALSVIRAAVRGGARRLVFASSGGTVYGMTGAAPIPETHPTQPMGAHGLGKLIVEQYLHVYRLRGLLTSVVLRTANAYGPGQWPERGQGAVATLLGRLGRGQPFDVRGDGRQVRDYVYAADVARAFAAAVDYAGPETVFNVGSGHGVSLLDLVRRSAEVTGRRPDLVFHEAGATDVPVNVLDAARARQSLGWTPRTPLDEGLRLTWRWVQDEWLPRYAPRP